MNPIEKKKFYRTVVQVEILHDEPMIFSNLEQVAYEIKDGHCSGVMKDKKVNEEITPRHMAKLLRAQGSDPEFLGLNDKGEIVEE